MERVVPNAHAHPAASGEMSRDLSDSRHYLGGCGVGVLFGKLGFHFFSLAVRMSRTEAPEACICIASRATSMHTAHVMPCGSH